MSDFDLLFNEYASTKNGDVFAFCQKYKENSVATRFLLIRSFNSENLKKLLAKHNISFAGGKEKELMKIAYDSDITIQNLLDYIEAKRPELIEEREKEVAGLDTVLQKIPIVDCGVRDDNVNTIVQKFTRNKNLKTYEELEAFLILSRVKQYCLWSYYNQTSNDIIELIFLKHKNVIPTLRKIYNIDFFLRVDDEIIPFDLKITHVSDDYFELASKGITANDNTHDNFTVNKHNASELENLKDYYKKYKKEHHNPSLQNISEFKSNTKATLSDYIMKLDSASANFVQELQQSHVAYVPTDQNSLKTLEWWNYKYQGERLFCNNNRLFVFLAHKTEFVDGRDLKRNTDEIERKINALLDNLSSDSIHTINYHYEKDRSLKVIIRYIHFQQFIPNKIMPANNAMLAGIIFISLTQRTSLLF